MKRLLIAGAVLGLSTACSAQQPAKAKAGDKLAAATFAGGCFWCTESDFDKMPGVISTTSGYTGGRTANPTYKQVSNGGTGHIEAVRVVYDPSRISYGTLATRFFRTIDPLDGGGQFCDRGDMYRSAIFVATPDQRRTAEAAKKAAAAQLRQAVATEILPAAKFYPAEDYHQDYYKKNPVRYRYYRYSCGREARIDKVWSKARR
jgi:peptide-methionine (S)-S-oxide reductase